MPRRGSRSLPALPGTAICALLLLLLLLCLLTSSAPAGAIATPPEETIRPTVGVAFSGKLGTGVGSQCPQAIENPTATIQWGDDHQTAATIGAISAGTFPVSGQHTYLHSGRFPGMVRGEYTCSHNGHANFEVRFIAEVAAATTTTTSTSTTTTTSSSSTSTTTTTTTSTVAPTPVGPPPVRASFTVGSVSAGHAVLDASASAPPGSQPDRYSWSITGGAAPDVVCQGSEPQLTVLTRAALHTTVSLTAVDASNGQSTLAQLPLDIPAPARLAHKAGAHAAGRHEVGVHEAGPHAARAASTGPSFQLLGRCAGAGVPPNVPYRHAGLTAGLPGASFGGAPPSNCREDTEFGAADIEGCLNEIANVDEIPGGVTLGLAQLLCGAKQTDFCVPALSALATSGASLLESAVSARAGGRATAIAGGPAAVARARARAAAVTVPQRQAVSEALNDLRFPVYYSTSPVRIDGLDVDPQAGSPLIVIPAADLILSVNAKVYLHSVPLALTPVLVLHLPDVGGHMGELRLPHSIPVIGSLPFKGSIGIDLHRAGSRLPNGDTCTYDCAAISVNAELPGVFSDGNGNGLSAGGVLTADDQQGLVLDSLEVKVPQADLGGIGVSNVDFRYLHGNDSLHGAATLELGPTGSFSATVDFLHGHFNGAHLEWSAGDGPGVDLGGPIPIFLTRLGGGVTLEPTVLEANGAIAGGPNVLGCSLFGIEAEVTMRFDPEFALDANGTGELLCQSVASEYFHLDGSGHIGLGGSVDVHFLVFHASGGIDFDVDVPQGHFQADAQVNACLELFGEHCLGAELVVSDRGIGLCADLGFTHAGGGIQFPSNGIIFFDTCDIGKFRSLGFTTAAHGHRAAASSFTVPRGQKVALIGLVGQGGTPRATLKGPDGRTIATPAGGYLKDPDEVVIAGPGQTNETYFFIDHPAAGPWTVTPEPGSPPIAQIQQAGALPSPAVHARVHAMHGGRGRLSYSLHALAGQQVSFAERQASGNFREIGRAHGSHGAIAFSPSPELAGARSVVATVTQDGHPRETVTVAHFHASRTPTLPAPHALKARRHGSRLSVSFKRVKGAAGYVLSAHLSDGRSVLLKLSAKQHGASIAAVPRNIGAHIELAALMAGPRLRTGRHARATLRAGAQPRPTVVKPERV